MNADLVSQFEDLAYGRAGKVFLPILGLGGFLALFGIALALQQGTSGNGTVIGIGIGGSGAMLFLLQRIVAFTGAIGELRGELKGVKENLVAREGEIKDLQREAAGVEERIGDSRHDVVDAINENIAELRLSMGGRLDRVEAILQRATGDPMESPAGRALKKELDQLHERLDVLTRRNT